MIYENYDELCRETRQMPSDTDLLAFTNLYKRLGIECRIYVSNEDGWVFGEIEKMDHFSIRFAESGTGDDGGIATICEKFGGYGGFYTSVVFDKNGKFVGQGFWE